MPVIDTFVASKLAMSGLLSERSMVIEAEPSLHNQLLKVYRPPKSCLDKKEKKKRTTTYIYGQPN